MPVKKPSTDHVPGPMEEAAMRAYFARGSAVAVEKGAWKLTALASITVSALVCSALVAVIMQQKVHVLQVAKDTSGSLQVVGEAQKFQADEDTKMAWASSYAALLTEITPAIWQRNVERLQALSVGVAVDQVKDYLQKADNNPPQMLSRFPLFVREYKRYTVNKVADNTYLIRYELTSRPAANVAPIVKTYAMTITLANVGHRTRDDVFRNPAGLAAMNFSISEDNK